MIKTYIIKPGCLLHNMIGMGCFFSTGVYQVWGVFFSTGVYQVWGVFSAFIKNPNS